MILKKIFKDEIKRNTLETKQEMDPDTGPAEGQGRSCDLAVVPLELGVVKQEPWGDCEVVMDLDTGQGHDQMRGGTTRTQLDGELNFLDARGFSFQCVLYFHKMLLKKPFHRLLTPKNLLVTFPSANKTNEFHYLGF